MKFPILFFGQSDKKIFKHLSEPQNSSEAILLATHLNIRDPTISCNDCAANLMVERPNKIDD